jgi:NADPH2 dehydrogenase
MAKILQKLSIGSLLLPNRLVMAPMGMSRATTDGQVTAKVLQHYDEKSRGGHIGLIIVEYSYVSQSGRSDVYQLSVADDSVIEGLQELSQLIHRNGPRCIVQINYGGDVAPENLTVGEIEAIVQAFGQAAGRVQAAGFDGVEIHAAHGFLLSRFYSPLTNKRTDDYNGGVQARIKLHLAVIAAVRETVGNDFPLFMRFGASDLAEGGATIEDGKLAAKCFVAAGVDTLDISRGLLLPNVTGLSGPGYLAHLAQAIKSAVAVPVIAVGGITEAQAAENLLANGQADLVSVGKAILKDSDWARRTIEFWQTQEQALWRQYSSNVVCGTGNNFIRRWSEPETLTFRSYYRVREAGEFNWRFWFGNTVDSTFAQGEQAWANRSGGRWRIEAACVAASPKADGSLRPETVRPVLYAGQSTRAVDPDEQFWSDEVTLTVLQDEYLVFSWSISVDQAGDQLPFTPDSQIPAFVAAGSVAMVPDASRFAANMDCAKPNLLAVARTVRKRIAFLGDSITEGCGTRNDYYEQWAARIGQRIGAGYAVWNLGLGYGRAADAASDGSWLAKAKHCDEVNICLGVNDLLHEGRSADAIFTDLGKIVRLLKESGVASIILLTVPPFNFTGEQEHNWRQLNKNIRNNPPTGVDKVFDIAAILSNPAPNENISRFDPHPGGDGGAEVAEAYLKWY